MTSSLPVPAGPPWLAGQVVDADGRPVVDTPVRIYGGLATRWQIGATRTDKQGRFSFRRRTESAAPAPPADAPRASEPAGDYVGVCAGETVGNFNPPAYLPWIDVQIAPGGGTTCRLVLDEAIVARRLAELQAR
ncbi:MAG: hypothetical protein AB8H80_08360 [Planctomycetota bacterium]